MNTLKTISIIGIIVSAVSFISASAADDWQAATGWGIISMAYLLAQSIVGIIQSKKIA